MRVEEEQEPWQNRSEISEGGRGGNTGRTERLSRFMGHIRGAWREGLGGARGGGASPIMTRIALPSCPRTFSVCEVAVAVRKCSKEEGANNLVLHRL